MPAHDPQTRSLIARIAATTRIAREDRAAMTAAARTALASKWERDVDPEGQLPEGERLKRAEAAKKTHYLRMALKSAQVRKLRAKADAIEAEVAADPTVGGSAV